MKLQGLAFTFVGVFLALPSQANELQFLDHSELALSRLYNDISEAQSTIDLNYYIWDPCSSASKVLMKKIWQKSRANPPVKVRILVDGYPQRKELGAMHKYFEQYGAELKIFNPGIDPSLNFRAHTKMALIDKDVPGQSRLITGGRNIADEYFGLARKNYVDRDVALIAPSSGEDRGGPIGQAKSGFDKLWGHRLTKKVSSASPESMERLKACTKWTKKDFELEKRLKANAPRVIASEKPVMCANVRFTADDMTHIDNVRENDGNEGMNGMPVFSSENVAKKVTSKAVLELVRKSQRSLVMENQYYIPDDMHFKGLMQQKRARNVKVEVFSNMFDGSDEKVVLWHSRSMQQDNRGSQANYSKARSAGLLDRWALTPKGATYTYHAKTFVADGKDTIVSSFNIDPRSIHTNGESALVVNNCPAFAGKVERAIRHTGNVWTLEEQAALCEGRPTPRPPKLDPFQSLLQFFTKELQ